MRPQTHILLIYIKTLLRYIGVLLITQKQFMEMLFVLTIFFIAITWHSVFVRASHAKKNALEWVVRKNLFPLENENINVLSYNTQISLQMRCKNSNGDMYVLVIKVGGWFGGISYSPVYCVSMLPIDNRISTIKYPITLNVNNHILAYDSMDDADIFINSTKYDPREIIIKDSGNQLLYTKEIYEDALSIFNTINTSKKIRIVRSAEYHVDAGFWEKFDRFLQWQ